MILRKKVKRTKGGTKISEIGLKPFPYHTQNYQKKSSEFVGVPLLFSPKDYEADSPVKRKEMSFQDAKNHEDFYRKLIKKGVYPEGTKVKVRRKRHSDSFHLEMKVPKIKDASKFGSSSREDLDKIKWGMKSKEGIIKSEGKKKGYNFRNVEEVLGTLLIDASPTYYEDIHYLRNYGVDPDGKIRYLDGEILIEKLPYEGRKKSEIEKKVDSLISDKSLEKKILFSISLGGFILGLFFISSNLTGNVIGNLNSSSKNIIGILIFFVSFLFAYLALKR